MTFMGFVVRKVLGRWKLYFGHLIESGGACFKYVTAVTTVVVLGKNWFRKKNSSNQVTGIQVEFFFLYFV